MATRQTVEAFTSALEAGDFETAAAYLADDFQFTSTMMPRAFGAQEWLAQSRALKAGVPDLSYNFRIEEIRDNSARVSGQLTGTHTNDLDLTAMGIGVVPATNIAFSAEREVSEGSVDADGRIQYIHLNSTPESGMLGMLKQLGLERPAP